MLFRFGKEAGDIAFADKVGGLPFDPVLMAFSQTLDDLAAVENGDIPAAAVNTLPPMARPGTRLRIDLAASSAIGTPLITLTQPQFLAR
ncbi:hypothetical protein [Yoonia sp. 2307UL14-13]|uniref:hypothetical protein n=1 Tax=Yoonia sp. 2307UL14-13 TaxID=3126506 RepID=UPI0030AC0FE1